MRKWFVVRTKPKNEERAKKNLENGGFEVLAPKIKYRRFKNGQVKETLEEMFPGYIFVRFSYLTDYRTVKYTRGVKDVVHFGEKVPHLDDNVIEYIRGRLKNGVAEIEREKIKAGEKVIVTQGPFKGFSGIFEREMKPYERVSILLEGLKYSARIILHRELIVPSGKNGDLREGLL